MKIKQLLLISIFLLFINNILKSQNSKFSDNLFLSVDLHHGYMLPKDNFVSYMVIKPINSIEFNVFKELTGKKDWQKVYGFPHLGFSLIYSTLSNDTVYGRAYTINPFLNFKILGRNKIFLFLRLGAGLGYVTKHYDSKNNYYNIAIGSNLNAYFNSKIFIRTIITKNINFNTGLSFSHLSNANLSEPNIGLNYLNFYAGFDARIGNKIEKNIDPVDKFQPKNKFEITIATGLKHTRAFEEYKYFIGSFSLNIKRQPAYKYQIGMGADFFYDSSTLDEMEAMGKADSKTIYKYRTGIHTSQELILGKLIFGVQEGFYIFPGDHLNNKKMYNRGVIQYNIYKNISLSIALKTHLYILDFLEWGISYQFN